MVAESGDWVGQHERAPCSGDKHGALQSRLGLASRPFHFVATNVRPVIWFRGPPHLSCRGALRLASRGREHPFCAGVGRP